MKSSPVGTRLNIHPTETDEGIPMQESGFMARPEGRCLQLGMLALFVFAFATVAQAQVTASPPYTVSVFAQAPANTSQPDSIVRWRDRVIVGFENHVAKDGTDGKSSTIVEFSLGGAVRRTFTVPGHNDGLRVVDDDYL